MQISEMSRAEVAELQRQLTALGHGELVPDGIWGPRTAEAYERYLATRPISLAVAPPPSKPWWTSTALIGGMISLGAWGASFAGFEFDVDSAKQAIPELIGAVFALMAVIGTWRRKAPIDPTLVVPGVRIPSRPERLRDPHLPTRPLQLREPGGAARRDARGHFSDDF